MGWTEQPTLSAEDEFMQKLDKLLPAQATIAIATLTLCHAYAQRSAIAPSHFKDLVYQLLMAAQHAGRADALQFLAKQLPSAPKGTTPDDIRQLAEAMTLLTNQTLERHLDGAQKLMALVEGGDDYASQ